MSELETITFQFNISSFTNFWRPPPPLSGTHENYYYLSIIIYHVL